MIGVDMVGGHWQQCSPAIYHLDYVIQNGSAVKIPKIDKRFSAHPGEVILFVRHWYFFNPDVEFPM